MLFVKAQPWLSLTSTQLKHVAGFLPQCRQQKTHGGDSGGLVSHADLRVRASSSWTPREVDSACRRWAQPESMEGASS